LVSVWKSETNTALIQILEGKMPGTACFDIAEWASTTYTVSNIIFNSNKSQGMIAQNILR
jgi:hypothetical protein